MHDVHNVILITPIQNGWTPLHAASQEGHFGIIQLLLKYHAPVDEDNLVRCMNNSNCNSTCCTSLFYSSFRLPPMLLLSPLQLS